ncbi:MAG: DUF2170 family protein [Cohaesibacteraceae bacterium]|nr:DUF2170 family protein [Cohaesibacteraceae bacterium]MBL4875819.1 DUF2170 family protein [Cohaesibacteraceae bacterium]
MVKDKNSAERQKRSRDKKRSLGLVSVQVWVPAWGKKAIHDLEAHLCNRTTTSLTKDVQSMTKISTNNLMSQLLATEEAKNGEITITKLDGATPIIQAVVQDVNEFPIMITVGEEQILMITQLWGIDEIIDGKADELNAVLLRANLPVPLSSFSIMGDRYVIFGALSINTNVTEITEEIFTLAENVIDALEFCKEYLRS